MASCYISWRLPHSAGGFFHKYRFVDETLSNIMGIILFAFLAVLVHGHPSNLPRDDIGENLFLSSSANIFTDTTLVSSLTPGDSDLGEASSNPFGIDGFIGARDSVLLNILLQTILSLR